jgi:DNA-binding response OmpR family regulator
MKILIVEDDRNYRAMIYEFLHSEGHEVLAVSDALHAVALLNEHTHGIDLVLLDLKMPRLGGGTLIETFASWPRAQTCFIVMSGEPEYSTYRNHPQVVACLHKPFSFAQLRKQIAKAEAHQQQAVAVAC